MKKDNKYKLAVFEDEDKADLVEYSKQMQKSIEKALDENQGEKGEKGDKGDKGDKGELVDLVKEEEGKNISIESANLPAIEVSIEGESQQATRSGKNLLDNTATTKISNGITFTVNSDKTVNVNGTNDTSANSSLIINRYELSPGTYILNGCPSGGASNTYRLAIQETGSYSILGSIDIGNGSGEFTIDTTTNVQIAIFIQKGLTINNLLFKPMLREATIADDTYEQYGASPSLDYLSEIENITGDIEFKVEGNNRFDKSKDFSSSNISKNLWTITQLENGLRVMSNYSSSTPYIRYIITDLSNFVGKTIRAKANFVSSSANKGGYRLNICNADGTDSTAKKITGESNKEISFIVETLEEGKNFLSFDLYSNFTGGTQSPTAYVDYTDIIITIDDENMTYEPYKSQVATFPLGEEKLMKGSYLADDGIHHVRKQYTFTGNEEIVLSNRQGENCARFYINKYDKQNNYITREVCSHFAYDSLAYKENRDVECITDNLWAPYRLIIFQILKTRLTSIDVPGCKAYLSEQYANGTPVIVEFELAKEEIVPYTETQKEAREKIKNMILYKGTNNISCTGKLKIKYYTNEEMNEIYAKKEDLHEHANKSILDQTQEAFTTELKNKLDGLNNYVLPAPTSTTLGGVKAGSNITIDADGTINAQLGSSGETSANDYKVLSNKPQIAGITLQGNKSLADLGIQGVETGKGLSSNDYTTTEKAKLAGVEAQANKYIHPSTSGYKHVPSGGRSGQVLKWQSDGMAKWDSLSSSGELSTDNLNTKKISGIYAQSTATNFLKSRNYPFDHADGFPFFDILLEVKNAGMYIMQELHLSYKISVQGQEVISYFTYMRFSTNNGSTWSAWRGHEGTTTQ